MGHDIGLKGAYYKPSIDDMLAVYLTGINNLTIDEANRLQVKVKKLEEDKGGIQAIKEEMKEFRETSNKLLSALAAELQKKGSGKGEILGALAEALGGG